MSNYSKLQEVLREIFEMDKADLDFGIYRVMNQKRKEVNEFIDKKLPDDIKKILAETQSKDSVELQVELDKMGKSLDEAGVLRETAPKYLALQEQIALAIDTNAIEQEVFSHLANFFKRYYKDGDFVSLRRYKKDVYAIPYEGEEVKLHWANADQYYIKTSEYLKNYAFKLSDGKKVHFQLKEASTEQNNNKSQGDVERRFAIYEDLPLEVQGDDLYINFTYEPHKKTVKQDELSKKAIEVIQNNIPSAFASAFDKAPTEKNKSRVLLEKHLHNFISRNTFDYFIHKDLGSFLRRELDFYIKNEVLFIDDINTENPAFFTAQLSKIKALKTVAEKIITFLAQVEDFQKKLWLKKKFVISTNYCITLDRIPEKYYPEIIENEAQLNDWKELFDVAPVGIEGLASEPFLVLDTKHFSEEFKDRLLGEFDNLDEETDGLLINSENFQGLNLISEQYKEKVDTVYIDPPYNSPSSEISYKNSFKHSSFASLMHNRLEVGRELLDYKGSQVVAIDENEQNNLMRIVAETFNGEKYDNTLISIEHNKKGIQGDHFSYSSEFAIFSVPYSLKKLNRIKLSEKDWEWSNLRNWGGESLRTDAKNCFYPIIVQENKIVGIGDVCDDSFHPNDMNVAKDGYIYIYPVDNDGIERKWRYANDTVVNILDRLKVVTESDGRINVQIAKVERPYKSMWYDTRHNAGDNGTKILTGMGFKKGQFDFPKSVYLVQDCLSVTDKENSLTLDYFAGSGTTGHAIIKLNRDSNGKGKRKYILVEMGTYFNTVTKPRIQKVIYSDNWKNGKPQDKKGISQLFKYQVLESYEDALNNLVLQSQNDGTIFSETAQEEYLLKYMLDIESRDHLFNIGMFRNPFYYQLSVTENNELVPVTVDLVETFNYLIGLYVDRVQRVKDIKFVEGRTREGQKTLVIWRNTETTSNEETQLVFRKIYDSVRSLEFDQIYINGDHHFDNMRTGEDQFKVKLIEETFFKKMFNISEL